MPIYMVKPWYNDTGGGGLPKIVTWAGGTDREIVDMVRAADQGLIDLADYWNVGDERLMTLGSIPATGSNSYGSWEVGEDQVSQTVTMVLMDTGHYTLTTPVLDKNGNTRTVCSFVVGQKGILSKSTGAVAVGYINPDQSNDGSWEGCKRRPWCNYGYYAAIPASIRPIFKQFEVITTKVYNGTELQTSLDMISLFACKEVLGNNGRGNLTEGAALTQVEYYKTTANQKKKTSNGTAAAHWFRSPHRTDARYWCEINGGGTSSSGYANALTVGFAPFGCI